jgi:hypothetical protein
MLLQVRAIQLQIQDLHMLYFLTYPLYFVDRYNVIEARCKYLREYCPLVLTNDRKQHRKSTTIIAHEKRRMTFGSSRDDASAIIMCEETQQSFSYHYLFSQYLFCDFGCRGIQFTHGL